STTAGLWSRCAPPTSAAPAPRAARHSMADTELKTRLEAIRLKAGPMMRPGEVREKSVPKMILVAPPRAGGVIATRSFIPHRAHASIGVFAPLSVATACLLPGSPAHGLARPPAGRKQLMLGGHPTGARPVSFQ